MQGEEGVLVGARPGSIIIDMSSISPLVDIAMEKKAREKGLKMLDAPVSGGEPGAIAGTLAIMVGGDASTFEEVKGILQVMGKSVVLVGEIGAGQFTKLANQILVAVHLQAMSEALVFAKKAGLDVQKVYEAVRGGLAGSNVLDAKVPLVLKRNYKPGFRIKLHIKDLKNALIAGRELGIPLPATALAQTFFEACDAAGRSNLDHGALITVTEELAKAQVGKED
jgi:2-hydroxy-3-oxopropionate reductase